jgi:hypothetical protein
VLVDRALRAFLSVGAGAVSALLKCGSRRVLVVPASEPKGAPDVPSVERKEVIPLAQNTVVVVVDDLDGQSLPEDNRQTVRWGLDGQTYELDLSDEHAAELRSALQRYIVAGRRVGRESRARLAGGGTRPRPPAGAGQRRDTAAIREWARSHGHQISDRGRIPADVLEAYAAAHQRGRGRSR